MIRLRIGDSERDLGSADESWINEQINRRRQVGEKICIMVFIKNESINIILSTKDCPPSNISYRMPNHEEKKVFDLWDKFGLDKSDFSVGNLIAFLKQISR